MDWLVLSTGCSDSETAYRILVGGEISTGSSGNPQQFNEKSYTHIIYINYYSNLNTKYFSIYMCLYTICNIQCMSEKSGQVYNHNSINIIYLFNHKLFISLESFKSYFISYHCINCFRLFILEKIDHFDNVDLKRKEKIPFPFLTQTIDWHIM